eukprot:m.213722 g.213722  ORF g.213722 m.213722 type:complete len:136 (-) comp15579_c0_seq3:913-1320(-)
MAKPPHPPPMRNMHGGIMYLDFPLGSAPCLLKTVFVLGGVTVIRRTTSPLLSWQAPGPSDPPLFSQLCPLASAAPIAGDLVNQAPSPACFPCPTLTAFTATPSAVSATAVGAPTATSACPAAVTSEYCSHRSPGH